MLVKNYTDAEIADIYDYQLAIDGDPVKATISTVRLILAG